MKRLGRKVFTSLDSERGVLQVSGEDALEFLQGLVTNDVLSLEENTDGSRAMCAGFLNPKGRMIAESLIWRVAADVLLLDCSLNVLNDLTKVLKMYRLRKKVAIENVSDSYSLYQVMAPDEQERMKARGLLRNEARATTVVRDPRWHGLGLRVICAKGSQSEVEDILSSPGHGFVKTDALTWTKWRMYYGVPEGKEVQGGIPLEMNFERLNGISFSKGCYTGQELIARTHFKGLVRKRLFPVRLDRNGFEGDGAADDHQDDLLPSWLLNLSVTGARFPMDFPLTLPDKAGRLLTAIGTPDSCAIGLAILRLHDHDDAIPLAKDPISYQGYQISLANHPPWHSSSP